LDTTELGMSKEKVKTTVFPIQNMAYMDINGVNTLKFGHQTFKVLK